MWCIDFLIFKRSSFLSVVVSALSSLKLLKRFLYSTIVCIWCKHCTNYTWVIDVFSNSGNNSVNFNILFYQSQHINAFYNIRSNSILDQLWDWVNNQSVPHIMSSNKWSFYWLTICSFYHYFLYKFLKNK